MYSKTQLIKKYLHYYLTAANGKGHGTHSPFVFDFIKNVLNDKKQYACYLPIEKKRKALLKNETLINVNDFGAGSSIIKTNKRAVKSIASSSLKPKKYAQLLFRMIHYYKPVNILELGTSFGVTAAYLACGNEKALLHTCEGSNSIASIAKNIFNELGLNNIRIIEGDFADTLLPLLTKIGIIDFAFVDGNHRKEPTLAYFDMLLQNTAGKSILVFDDIHWSEEMEEAWEIIKQHPMVSITVDLFFIGIVFLNPDFKNKQHFTIRF